jgi:hypothetical protein
MDANGSGATTMGSSDTMDKYGATTSTRGGAMATSSAKEATESGR